MTSPDGDFTTRLRQAAASIGADKPGMAMTLANSDLTTGDMSQVGGFVQGLETAQLVRLARHSGARLDLSPEQRQTLDALGEQYVDVTAEGEITDNRNMLERVFEGGASALANTGSFLLDNPVADGVFGFFNFLSSAAKLPVRLISSGLDRGNDDEIDAAMEAKGYDPGDTWDYLGFMLNEGDSQFHDLDGLRDVHGDELVDLAVQQMMDPEAFAESLLTADPRIQELASSDEFRDVADLVDRQHISPGRDIARILTFGNVDTAAFTAISGVLDGAYTILLDPTLLAGAAIKGVRALDAAGNAINPSKNPLVRAGTRSLDRATGGQFRAGLRDALDQDGIRKLLAVDNKGRAVTRAGQGVQLFLERVKKFDELDDGPEKNELFARMQAEHKALMPFFDEVRGKRVVLNAPAKMPPERTLIDDLVDEADDVLPKQLDQDAIKVGDAILVRTDGDGKLVSDARVIDRGAEYERLNVTGVAKAKEGRTTTWTYTLEDGRTVSSSRAGRTGNWPYVVEGGVQPRSVPVITDAALPSIDGKLVDANKHGWLTTDGDRIETLEDFAEYFASTAGFLRLANGAAAKRELILPGRVALRSRAAGGLAAWRQRRLAGRHEVIDHSKPYRALPHEAEEAVHQNMDGLDRLREQGLIDEAEFKRRGDAIYEELRGQAGWIRQQRAKWEQRSRRLSSLLPEVQALDLTSADSIEQVRRFARLYMSKAEADRLAAVYAQGDLGRRRQVAMGIVEQTLHASGLTRSAEGLKIIEKFRLDQEGLRKRAYGLAGTDVIVTESGRRHVALLPSQLSERVLLPDFRTLQYAATKLAVGGMRWSWAEAGASKARQVRAGLTGNMADAVMGAIKLGWITSAAGGTRNALDEVAGATLTGHGVDLLRGRRAWKAGVKADRASRAEQTRAARLQARMLPRIPRALRGQPKTVDDTFLAATLGKLMSYTKTEPDEAAVRYAREAAEDQREELLDDTIVGTYYGDDLRKADADAESIHRSGLMAQERRHLGDLVKHEFQGYDMVEVDGGVGLNAFVDNLGMAFQDLTSPAHVALRGIVEGRDALTEVVEYVASPAMRHFRANAEVFKVTRSGKPVKTVEQEAEAIERYAENLIAHVTMLVSGRGARLASDDELAGAAARWENDVRKPGFWNDPDYAGPGPINQDMVEMLLKGDIPDRVWIKENLADEEIPSHVIGKVFTPINPTHAPGQFLQGYTTMLAKAYDVLVTKQVRGISRNPMYTAAYVQARRNLESYESFLKEQGFDDEAASQIVRRMARGHAEQLVIKSIDNPQQSTQYAMLARNFHAFARAQEDWLRRWGRFIRDDPTVLRKAQLALHGAESAGLVERDDQGRIIFTYPGSGVVINAFNKVTAALGMSEMVEIPVVPDLTSQVIFLNPSLDNPIGFSATPLMSIPFDVMAATVGADYPLWMSSLDKAINGELGAGREWYEKIMPGWTNRILQGVLMNEDPASQFASAYTQALMNMEAAGQLDHLTGANPTELAVFQHRLRSQIQNQMVARSLLGFFAPAAPGMPTNDVIDAETGESVLKADWAWHKLGIESLKDEARWVFSKMPYDKAMEWWQANHPGELIYRPGAASRTEVGESDAVAAASVAAAKWVQDNDYLVQNYGGKGGIAAYFIPQGIPDTESGEFSQVAYRAQLESGIREHKSLEQFFTDLIVQRGESIYFDTKDDVDAAIAEATAAGDGYTIEQLQTWWDQQKALIKQTNPLMAAKFAEYATAGVARERTVSELNRLLSDEKAVAALGTQAGGIAEMLLAKREYEAALLGVKGERGFMATSTRDSARHQFEATIADITARFPGLSDLARGTFRLPD